MAKSNVWQKRKASWLDLTHDVLFVIMMKVEVVDFLACSRVCKSWRSVALSNKNRILESRPPLLIWINHLLFRGEFCYLQDSYGRRITRILRHSRERKLIGVTHGYLILFGKETRDFWLVNPIKGHGLHFPAFTYSLDDSPDKARAILVFSPSMSGWVFVMAPTYSHKIWYSIAGKGAWNHFTSDYPIINLHVVKGKIYAVTNFCRLCELRLNPLPKVTLLETKNLPDVNFLTWKIVSSGEDLYVTGKNAQNEYTVWVLDTCELKWVLLKNTIEYFFDINQIGFSYLRDILLYGDIGYVYFPDKIPTFPQFWYFPNDCLSV